MIRVVSVKFRTAGKQYDFNAQGLDLDQGTQVIVETDRGRAMGKVVQPPRELPRLDTPEDLKAVLRIATDEDLALAEANLSREQDAFKFCLRRIQERSMEMKLVRAEYLFDGSKIIFYFTADGRIDFRELVKDLAHHFHTRIEMRQIGVRDEAKLTGGIGICGRELCCCTFLTDFTPVSVKMAKEQGLALNPNKISGQCGRLLCCLSYEYETYCVMKKGLPKCGKKVQFGSEEAEVVDQNVLAGTVTVVLEDGKKKEFSADELEKGPAPAQRDTRPPSEARPSRKEDRPGSGRDAPREGGRPKKGRPPRPQKPRSTSPDGPRQSATPPEAASPGTPDLREPGSETKKKSRNRRRPRRDNTPRR